MKASEGAAPSGQPAVARRTASAMASSTLISLSLTTAELQRKGCCCVPCCCAPCASLCCCRGGSGAASAEPLVLRTGWRGRREARSQARCLLWRAAFGRRKTAWSGQGSEDSPRYPHNPNSRVMESEVAASAISSVYTLQTIQPQVLSMAGRLRVRVLKRSHDAP